MRRDRRVLFCPPPGAPAKVREEGSEGHVPYYCRWDDGSEYLAYQAATGCVRAFHGPLFSRPIGDWCMEPPGAA